MLHHVARTVQINLFSPTCCPMNHSAAPVFRGGAMAVQSEGDQALLRRRITPRPAKPMPRRVSVMGSGTGTTGVPGVVL